MLTQCADILKRYPGLTFDQALVLLARRGIVVTGAVIGMIRAAGKEGK